MDCKWKTDFPRRICSRHFKNKCHRSLYRKKLWNNAVTIDLAETTDCHVQVKRKTIIIPCLLLKKLFNFSKKWEWNTDWPLVVKYMTCTISKGLAYIITLYTITSLENTNLMCIITFNITLQLYRTKRRASASSDTWSFQSLQAKELSFCHKLAFSNSYIFATLLCKHLTFQT